MAYPVRFCTLLLLILVIAPQVDARKKLLGSKSGSTASAEVKTQDPQALTDPLIGVFVEDGYDIELVSSGSIRFGRAASRMQELSYGSLMHPGSHEVVMVNFSPINEQSYRVDCNVTIRTGGESALADSNVLSLFGRQYKRMLRRVERAVKKAAKN
jgi:hypothetical protein